MERVRTIACSLLPVLWALAGEPCLADAISGRGGSCQTALMFAAAQGGHGPLTDLGLLQQAARMLSRRMGGQIGWGGAPTSPAIAAFRFNDVEHDVAPLPAFTAAPGSATCWQFHWRTAAQPRAPSFAY